MTVRKKNGRGGGRLVPEWRLSPVSVVRLEGAGCQAVNTLTTLTTLTALTALTACLASM